MSGAPIPATVQDTAISQPLSPTCAPEQLAGLDESFDTAASTHAKEEHQNHPSTDEPADPKLSDEMISTEAGAPSTLTTVWARRPSVGTWLHHIPFELPPVALEVKKVVPHEQLLSPQTKTRTPNKTSPSSMHASKSPARKSPARRCLSPTSGVASSPQESTTAKGSTAPAPAAKRATSPQKDTVPARSSSVSAQAATAKVSSASAPAAKRAPSPQNDTVTAKSSSVSAQATTSKVSSTPAPAAKPEPSPQNDAVTAKSSTVSAKAPRMGSRSPSRASLKAPTKVVQPADPSQTSARSANSSDQNLPLGGARSPRSPRPVVKEKAAVAAAPAPALCTDGQKVATPATSTKVDAGKTRAATPSKKQATVEKKPAAAEKTPSAAATPAVVAQKKTPAMSEEAPKEEEEAVSLKTPAPTTAVPSRDRSPTRVDQAKAQTTYKPEPKAKLSSDELAMQQAEAKRKEVQQMRERNARRMERAKLSSQK